MIGRTWQGIGKKALTFWLKSRGGAVADEGADNSQGELFTPTEGGWDGRLFGTESWYHQRQLALVCCAQALTVQHSWSIGRPDEKGFCRVVDPSICSERNEGELGVLKGEAGQTCAKLFELLPN